MQRLLVGSNPDQSEEQLGWDFLFLKLRELEGECQEMRQNSEWDPGYVKVLQDLGLLLWVNWKTFVSF